ncbi:uncharacterized protein LOC124134947 [Haliotis rufescens]|uniref:uncharacterized protein LOC124134947 n=1 Tax=Haliotis rufescens TaxID=6454 RepID=UPI001EAFFB4A|nr:uncharacterized protein LOC124134947 [Haliotis rufescens]
MRFLGMELMCVYSFACLLVSILGSPMCSSWRRFGPLQVNSSILNATFETVDHVGLLQCVRGCYVRSRCKSFAYETETETCFLNSKTDMEVVASDKVNTANTVYSNIADWPGRLAGVCYNHTCSHDSICVDRNEVATCDTVYCFPPTSPTNGRVLLDGSPFYERGHKVEFRCNTGYRGDGELVCGEAGVWEDTAICIPPPVTCKEVRQCNSSYGDGEYWLLYNSSSNVAVKIYCWKMELGNFWEFITLPEEHNFALFPTSCENKWKTSYCGRTTFAKVRVYHKKLSGSNRKDFSTAECSGGNAPIGRAGSCSEEDACRDREPGYFKINTTGTGFIIDPDVTWKVTVGHVNVTRSDDGQVIHGTCLSNCGQCYPDTLSDWYPLFFIPDPNNQPPESAAVVPICK